MEKTLSVRRKTYKLRGEDKCGGKPLPWTYATQSERDAAKPTNFAHKRVTAPGAITEKECGTCCTGFEWESSTSQCMCGSDSSATTLLHPLL